MVRNASTVLPKGRGTRDMLRSAGGGAPGAEDPPVTGTVPPGQPGTDGYGPVREERRQPPARSAARPGLGNVLKNWRVRSRLLLLVIIPTVTAVAAGGVFIGTSVEGTLVNQRILTMASLSGKTTGLVQALQGEREDVVKYIVLDTNGGRAAANAAPDAKSAALATQKLELQLLRHDYAATDALADSVKSLAGGIGGAYPALAQQDTQAAVTAIGNLSSLRAAATRTQLPASNVITEYATAINALLAVESQIAVGSGDSTLAGAVRVLGLVSSMKEQASQQQAVLTSALGPDLITLGAGGLGPAQQAAISTAQAQQQGSQNELVTAATQDQFQVFNSALSQPNVVQAQALEQQAISLTSSNAGVAANDPTVSNAAFGLSYVVGGMRSAEQQYSDAVIGRAGSLHSRAITEAIIYSLAVALLLAVALGATVLVGRSMVGPLRRLRNGALEVAGSRLPDTVRQMSEMGPDDVMPAIEPIDVDSSDEIGEVARAFDQVHREAVRLASNEAALRGTVNAMFVNLSRRSQTLVERQIRVITTLEHGEQDPERLSNLFQVDHLATRMRRNSENLLVLAGQEFTRRWGQPVALVDVVRAAVSEIEQYERVTTNVQPGISIRREAVRDVVHLVAELTENATTFSADDTPVTIDAFTLTSGGALIEIADQGVGMKPAAMAHANDRLDNPPTVDVEVSRRMGLFVVAQLAVRHGIRVRLRPASTGGLSALVWLPHQLIAVKGEGASAPPAAQVPAAAVPSPAGPPPVSVPGAAPVSRTTSVPSLPPRQLGANAPGRDSDNGYGNDSGYGTNSGYGGGNDNGYGAPGSTPRPRLERLGMAEPAAPSFDQPLDQPLDQRLDRRLDQRRDQRAESFSTPQAADQAPSSAGVTGGWADSSPHGRVTGPVKVPPAEDGPAARGDRLPIFDAVESDWFGGAPMPAGVTAPGSENWSSPGDSGWRAAAAASAPASDGDTSSGLPKRAPGANFVPGRAASSSGGPASDPAAPRPARARSASVNRNRFASYQRGLEQGRAAAGDGQDNGGGTTS